MKIAVSIPDPLFAAAERLARRRKLSRSQLYAQALERLLVEEDDDSLTARLDAVYADGDEGMDPQLARAQGSSVAEEW